jgi:predicted TIM-barrel fold metal-dependent hydrolase
MSTSLQSDRHAESVKGQDTAAAWSRRAFLGSTAALAAAAALPARGEDAKPSALIDCNVTIGNWPFRSLSGKDVLGFSKHLSERGASQAWAGSFEGIFYRDLATANRALYDACTCQFNGLLLPVGAINPTLPAWKDDLTRCAGEHGMKAIRLHPNYHSYTLDDPRFLELLSSATERKILVQIVAQMEDERTQHPLMQVKPVNFKPLPAALKQVPSARVMVLNASRAMSMTALEGSSAILDIAMLEGVGGIEMLLKDWPIEQLVFGSHAPLFYFESAKLKLQESELTDQQLAAITHENAQRLLA